MTSNRLILRPLKTEDAEFFHNAVMEFNATDPDIKFAFQYDEKTPFEAYVDKMKAWSRGEDLPPHFVPNTILVGVVAGRIVGRISLRHELNDFLDRIGGHIGYCVVPSQRRRGYATEMLRQSLGFARQFGLGRVLVTCDTDNVGSRKSILKNGGVLENTTNEPELKIQKYRYWIGLTE